MKREGTELSVDLGAVEGRRHTFVLVDTGTEYEAKHHVFEEGRGARTDALALSPEERGRLLAAASGLSFADHDPPLPPGRRCVRAIQSRNWQTKFAQVCAPATAPLVEDVARLLGVSWPP